SATTETEDAAIADELAWLDDPAWTSRVGRRLIPHGVKLAAETCLTDGAYKAPGGLIRVRLLAREDRIADIEISGDFTCNPAAGIAALAERLKGEPLSSPALGDRIAGAMSELRLDLPGVTPQDLAAAIEQSQHREA